MNKSESIIDLAKALSAFQGALKPAIKDAENPFFRSHYADLAGVIEAIKEPLKANGLSVSQVPCIESDKMFLTTLLMHSSGQWISGDYLITAIKPNDPQSIGSAITYARRYALSAILGVATEDDDAESATGRKPETKTEPKKEQQQTPAKVPPQPVQSATNPIKEQINTELCTEPQQRKIFASSKAMGYSEVVLKALMLAEFKTEHTKELTKIQASKLIEEIAAGKGLE